MNLKRFAKILLGALAGVAIDNMAGFSTMIIGLVPPPWNVLAGPAIGALLNAGAKWLRDNTAKYEFKPKPVAITAKAVAKVL